MRPVFRSSSPFALMTPNPFVGRLDRVFGEDGAAQGWSAPASVALWQDDDQYFVEADMPGVAEADVELTVHKNVLTIRGDRKAAEGRVYLYNGQPVGRFERTITLPEPVTSADVRAELRDGVLRLTLPKSPEAKPRKITLGAAPATS